MRIRLRAEKEKPVYQPEPTKIGPPQTPTDKLKAEVFPTENMKWSYRIWEEDDVIYENRGLYGYFGSSEQATNAAKGKLTYIRRQREHKAGESKWVS